MATIYWPLNPSAINYGFGYPPGYGGFHNGIDFRLAQGSELRATASGTIRNVDAGTVDGWGVDIITDDGWKVRMWHTSKFIVPNGSRVEAGQVVALSGGTPGTPGAGNATGPHLHWGIMVGGNWVDPASLNPQNFDQPTPSPFVGEDMKLVRTVEGTSYLFREDGIVAIASEQDFNYLKQIIETPTSTYMLTSELMSVAKYVVPTAIKVDVNYELIKSAVKEALAGIDINVDALAQAIADKIDCGGKPTPVDVTTKAEILDAIETNYPEDK